jgi:hypothetical protein
MELSRTRERRYRNHRTYARQRAQGKRILRLDGRQLRDVLRRRGR